MQIDLAKRLAACGIARAVLLILFISPLNARELLAQDAEVVEPRATIRPLTAMDKSGVYTWLKESGREDPKQVFSVKDGVLHISGEGAGYLATEKAYRDYHLSVEYKWGKKADGSKFVRNSGVLLHGTGPDGAASGVWMASLECQLAQGCEGDLIVIRGKGEDGKPFPATITSETRIDTDKRTRWEKGGAKTVYSGKQFWWSKHDPAFEELLDTRGRWDVASPLGEWTRVECICRGDRVTIKINGETVNECFDVVPRSGKILLQNEGSEIYFRNFEIGPLK
jgi:hypothetical protein